MIPIQSGAPSMAAAWPALLLLSFASVRSIVMHAAMPTPGGRATICGASPIEVGSTTMVSMDGRTIAQTSSPDRHRSAARHAHSAACPYCAAAAHAPILVYAVPTPDAVAVVFTAFQLAAGHGPRGPPARQPRARGPPAHLLTV